MKIKLLTLRIAVYLILSFLFTGIQAQSRLEQPIPVDAQIRIGKLDNGFTYYIRNNHKPENRVEMRLAVKAGSVLEDEDQRGLAHFVEHMAFNGTKNFAKNDLISYLQSVGVQFGPEINAYTSLDETVYMLTLPSDSAVIVRKGFEIMEDWAHNLSFDGLEIDKERGIIVEEWRIGQGPNQRMQEKLFPVLFNGSQYASRLPIGKKEIIEKAPHDKIRKFYTDWYRPDLMAFIIVGDIDPDSAERSIKKHFGGLTMPESPRLRQRYKIPDQPGTAIALATDKEMPYTAIQIVCKTDPIVQVYQKDYRESLKIQLVSSMLNQRVSELREQADPPLLMSAVQFSSLGTREKSAFQMIGIVSETGIERGIEAIIMEAEKAIRFGFSEGELERQKKQFLSFYETAYNERDKTESEGLASEYIRNFIADECIPGIVFEYEFVREFMGGITIEEINTIARGIITRDNRVVMILGPEKESVVLPNEEIILSIIDKTEKGEVEAYVDKFSGEQLLAEMPAKGRILLTKKNKDLDVVEMNLSNGAKVILKPTDFKNDQILFRAFSPGGYSLYGEIDHESAVYAADIVGECGLADYSPNDLEKLLAGKVVSVNPYIDAYYEGISASAKPADIESMMQLIYMSFTQPRKDSMLYHSFITQQKGVIKNLLADPENYFSDQYSRIKSQNHRMGNYIPTEEDIDRIQYDRVFEIYKERFADASGFTFFFVGSFKTDSLKPLVETYLASLPSTRTEETWVDMGIRPPQGKVNKPLYKGNDPKSMVAVYFETVKPWQPEQSHIFNSLGQLLDIKYTEVLREEMSGVYGMGVDASLVKIPYNHLSVSITIPCSPENTDLLTKVAIDEIKKIQKSGVSEVDLNKIKEAQRRSLESNLKQNNYWIGQLAAAYQLGDPGRITEASKRIEAVSSESLQAAANMINLKKYVRVVLYPEKN